MKTKDGRCPLLCLLKSNALSNKTKLEVFDKIVSTFSIPISDEVRNRLEELKNYENKGKQNSNKNKNPDPYPECPYITDILTTEEKSELYNSVINNQLNVFKSLIYGSSGKKAYPIFEEISAPSYKWTALHYAMHYAKWDIIKFIFEYLYQNDLVNIALNMKTKDERCPLLCLLRSNILSSEIKKEIFKKIIMTFHIPISIEVKYELIKRSYDDLLLEINSHF